MHEVSPGHVNIYFTFQNEITEQKLLDSYQELLSETELRQQQRFYFIRDQHRYLITRALTRTVLSKYSSIQAKDWIFTKNTYGRPEIANKNPFPSPISFNISHTRDLIMLGIAQRSIGVDVENIRIKRSSLKIADRYFSDREIRDLNSLPEHDQYERFFHYWTLKEAYIKARGMGLSIPLKHFSYHFPDPKNIKISFTPHLMEDEANWHFWLLKPTANHIAAIGLECVQEKPEKVEIRKIVPLDSEAPFACTILRQTEIGQ